MRERMFRFWSRPAWSRPTKARTTTSSAAPNTPVSGPLKSMSSSTSTSRKADKKAMKYEQPSSDDRRIWNLLLAQSYQPAVVVADESGVFTALDEKPATIAELAARLDFDERATGILLRLIGALGLLTQRTGRYHLTDEARVYLVRSGPFYWGPMMSVGVSEWHRTTLLSKLKKKGS